MTFYANDHIRYLVNKHKPNKKDKKNIEGQGWMYYIDVEDKGNIAIFNPYCVDPLNPLSFYVNISLLRLLTRSQHLQSLSKSFHLFPKFKDKQLLYIWVANKYTYKKTYVLLVQISTSLKTAQSPSQ